MNSRQVIKELKKAGFVLVNVSGDHHKFKHENGKIVIVPHPQKRSAYWDSQEYL